MTKHYLNTKYQVEQQRTSAMKKLTLSTATIILGSLVYFGADSQNANAAEVANVNSTQSTQVSQATSQPINFEVQKDGSSEKSHMDDYMQHPGKVIKQNNKYYFQAVLNNASFWKEYKFYNKNNQELATTVVNDDKKADTRTINVAVEPGYKSLTTKVHIVVPQINYNHRYTTHLEFEKAIPTLADAAKPNAVKPAQPKAPNEQTKPAQPKVEKVTPAVTTPSKTEHTQPTKVVSTEAKKEQTNVQGSQTVKPVQTTHEQSKVQPVAKNNTAVNSENNNKVVSQNNTQKSDKVVKQNATQKQTPAKESKAKELPKTGLSSVDSFTSTVTFATLALLGSLSLLFRRKASK